MQMLKRTAVVFVFVVSPYLLHTSMAAVPLSDTVIPLGSGSDLKFVRLPATSNADIFAGLGSVAPRDDGSRYELAATFLAETELTVSQLKLLIPEAEWISYRDRLVPKLGPPGDAKWGTYQEAVVAGVGDFPAVMVGIKEIVAACQALEDISQTARTDVMSADVFISRTFRIPSAVEWRYAAGERSELARDDVGPFLDWPILEGDNEGKWRDLVNGMPAYNPNQSPSAEQLCRVSDEMIVKNVLAREGYELLGDVFMQFLGLEINVFITSEQRYFPVHDDTPSAWSFHRMYGNAPEFVLTGNSRKAVDDLWAFLVNGSKSDLLESDRECGFALGGQYRDTVPQEGAWRKWSFLYGEKNSDDRPFSVRAVYGEDAQGKPTTDIVDLRPGVRLCMVEDLRTDWFARYRSALRSGDELSAVNDALVSAATNVSLPEDQAVVQQVVDAYLFAAPRLWGDAASEGDLREIDEKATVMHEVGLSIARKFHVAEEVDSVAQASAGLAALLGGTGDDSSQASTVSSNGDEFFFETLNSVPPIPGNDDI